MLLRLLQQLDRCGVVNANETVRVADPHIQSNAGDGGDKSAVPLRLFALDQVARLQVPNGQNAGLLADPHSVADARHTLCGDAGELSDEL